MRKAFSIAAVWLLVVSVGLAQETNTTKAKAKTPEVLVEPTEGFLIFRGRTDGIVLEELQDEMPGRIDVVDENGQKLIFFVTKKETVIADKQGLATSFYKIDMGDEVIVYYTKEPHNRKVARFIKLTE